MKRFIARLKEKTKGSSVRPVIYVAFGDSVTQGCREYGNLDPQGVYHAKLRRTIRQFFPKTVIEVINSGVGGENAAEGCKRLERDVLAFSPDLVTIAFGLNDAWGGKEGVEQYKSALSQMVSGIRRQTEADVVFITPNMMLTRDNPNVHPQHKSLAEEMLRLSTGGILDLYVDAMRTLAAQLDVPVADAYAAWKGWEREGRDINQLLSNGLNHPGEEGHALVSRLLWQLIESYR